MYDETTFEIEENVDENRCDCGAEMELHHDIDGQPWLECPRCGITDDF